MTIQPDDDQICFDDMRRYDQICFDDSDDFAEQIVTFLLPSRRLLPGLFDYDSFI